MSSRFAVTPINGAAPLSELSDRHTLVLGPEVSAVVAGRLELRLVSHFSKVACVAPEGMREACERLTQDMPEVRCSCRGGAA